MFKQATQKGTAAQQPPKKKKKNKDKKKDPAGNVTPTNAKSRNHSPEQAKILQPVANQPEPTRNSALAHSTSARILDSLPQQKSSVQLHLIQQQ